MATAFALIGDRYHNSDYIRTALGKTLGGDLGLWIDFTDEVKLLNAERLRGYRLLILFRDGMIWPGGYGERVFWSGGESMPIESQPPLADSQGEAVYWMTGAQGQAVRAFVMGGGAALFYHNATYIASHNPDFREVLGAATEGHPPVRPFRVEITHPEHPIVRGANSFLVTDEQHFMTYDLDPDFIFMRSVNEAGSTYRDLGSSSPAGWAYDCGLGRVCYLAPGHLIPALWNPEYEKIQRNAVRWLLRQAE